MLQLLNCNYFFVLKSNIPLLIYVYINKYNIKSNALTHLYRPNRSSTNMKLHALFQIVFAFAIVALVASLPVDGKFTHTKQCNPH